MASSLNSTHLASANDRASPVTTTTTTTTTVNTALQSPSRRRSTGRFPRTSPTREHFRVAMEAYESRQRQALSAAHDTTRGPSAAPPPARLPTAQYTYRQARRQHRDTQPGPGALQSGSRREPSGTRGVGRASAARTTSPHRAVEGGQARRRSPPLSAGLTRATGTRAREVAAAVAAAEDEMDDGAVDEKATARRVQFFAALQQRTHAVYMDTLNAAMDKVPLHTPPPPSSPSPPRRGSRSPSPQRRRQQHAHQERQHQSRLRSLLSMTRGSYVDVERSLAGLSRTASPSPSASPFRALPGPVVAAAGQDPLCDTHASSSAPLDTLSPNTPGLLRVAKTHTKKKKTNTKTTTKKTTKTTMSGMVTTATSAAQGTAPDSTGSHRTDVAATPALAQAQVSPSRSSSASASSSRGVTADFAGLSPLSSPNKTELDGPRAGQPPTRATNKKPTDTRMHTAPVLSSTQLAESTAARVPVQPPASGPREAAALFSHARRTLALEATTADEATPSSGPAAHAHAPVQGQGSPARQARRGPTDGPASRRRLLASLAHYQGLVGRRCAQLLAQCHLMDAEREAFIRQVQALLARPQTPHAATTTTTTTTTGEGTTLPSSASLPVFPSSSQAATSASGLMAEREGLPLQPARDRRDSSLGSRSHTDTLSVTLPSHGGGGGGGGGGVSSHSTRTLAGSSGDVPVMLARTQRAARSGLVEDDEDEDEAVRRAKAGGMATPGPPSASLPSSVVASTSSASSSRSSLGHREDDDDVGDEDDRPDLGQTFDLVLRAQETIISAVDSMTRWRAVSERRGSKDDKDDVVVGEKETDRDDLRTALLTLPQHVEEQRQRSQTLAEVPLPLALRAMLQTLWAASQPSPTTGSTANTVSTMAAGDMMGGILGTTGMDHSTPAALSSWQLMRPGRAATEAPRTALVSAVSPPSSQPVLPSSTAATAVSPQPEPSWSLSSAATSMPIVSSATLRAGALTGTACNSPASPNTVMAPPPLPQLPPSQPTGEDELLSISRATSGQSAATAAFSPHSSLRPVRNPRVAGAEKEKDDGTSGRRVPSPRPHPSMSYTVTMTSTSTLVPSSTTLPTGLGGVAAGAAVVMRPRAETADTPTSAMTAFDEAAKRLRRTPPPPAAQTTDAAMAATEPRHVRARSLHHHHTTTSAEPVVDAAHRTQRASLSDATLPDRTGDRPSTGALSDETPPPLPVMAMDQLLRTFYRRAREQVHVWEREKHVLLRAQAEATERVRAAQATSAEARAAALAVQRERRRARVCRLREDCAALYREAMALDVVAQSHDAHVLPNFVHATVVQGRHQAAHRLYERLRQSEKEAVAPGSSSGGGSARSRSSSRSRKAKTPQAKDGGGADIHGEATAVATTNTTTATASTSARSGEPLTRTASSTPSESSPILDPSPRALGWANHSFAASLSARADAVGGDGGGGGAGSRADPLRGRAHGGALSAYEHYQSHDWPARLRLSRHASGQEASDHDDDDDDDQEIEVDDTALGAARCDDAVTRFLSNADRSSAWTAVDVKPTATTDPVTAAASGVSASMTAAAVPHAPSLLPPSSRRSRAPPPPHHRRAVRLSSAAALHAAERLVDLGCVLKHAQEEGPAVTAASSSADTTTQPVVSRPRSASIPCTPSTPGAPPRRTTSFLSPKSVNVSMPRSASWYARPACAHKVHPDTSSPHPHRDEPSLEGGTVRKPAGVVKRTTPFLLHDLDFIYTPSNAASGHTPGIAAPRSRASRPTSAPVFALHATRTPSSTRKTATTMPSTSTVGRPPRPSSAAVPTAAPGVQTTTRTMGSVSTRRPPLGSTYHQLLRPGYAARTTPSLSPAHSGGGGAPSGFGREHTRVEELRLEGQGILDTLPSDVRERVLRRATQ